MIFESADGPLGSIASMYVGGRKLEVNFSLMHLVLEDARCFIIKALQFWLKPPGGEEIVDLAIGLQDGCGRAVLEWRRDDCVAIIITKR